MEPPPAECRETAEDDRYMLPALPTLEMLLLRATSTQGLHNRTLARSTRATLKDRSSGKSDSIVRRRPQACCIAHCGGVRTMLVELS